MRLLTENESQTVSGSGIVCAGGALVLSSVLGIGMTGLMMATGTIADIFRGESILSTAARVPVHAISGISHSLEFGINLVSDGYQSNFLSII